MTSSVPLLFTGDVAGNYNYLFKKIRNILLKTKTDKPFLMLLCGGDFFGDNFEGWKEYTSYAKNVPMETFILGPVNKKQIRFYPSLDACDVVNNLSYLGKYGVYTTGEGLRIAYISGLENGKIEDCSFSLEEINKLVRTCTDCKGEIQTVNVLISYQWPHNITGGLNEEFTPQNSSKLLGYLISKIRPHYHFATHEKKSFERAPFPHYDAAGTLLGYTRFIGLAAVGNELKNKSIYALKVQIAKPENTSIPVTPLPKDDTTSYPFQYVSEFEPELTNPTINQFFYSSTSQNIQKRVGDEDRRKKKRKHIDYKSTCWFCLSNRKVDKYLIISVASECYLALAKGGVVDNHSLITTISHYATANAISEVASDEILQFKMSLRQYFRGLKMEIIFYERAFKTTHLQIHCIPLAANLFKHFKPALMARVKKENLVIEEYRNGTQAYQSLPPDCKYFFIDIPNDNELLIRITDDDFPLSFGRDIIAEDILNVPERSDWQKCVLDEEIAEAIVNDFREGYQKYDFTEDN